MNRNPKTFVLPEFSNREDLYLPFGVFDDDTGDPVDMVALGWTFQFEIRRMPPNGSGRGWVGPYYDEDDIARPLIVLALGTGPNAINIVDVGMGVVWASESEMRKLRHRTYRAALFANDGTRQFRLFIATLPNEDGGVTN